MNKDVKKIFDMADQFSANSPKGQEWLRDLRSDFGKGLISGSVEINKLSGYVRGLWASGVIDIEQINDFDKVKADAGY